MRKNERGFSLVELAIASGILGLVVIAIYSLMHSASDSYIRDTARQTLQDNAREALDRITAELRDADQAVLVTTNPTTIRFRRSVGYDATAATTLWSGYIEYKYELPDNMLDTPTAVKGRIRRIGPDASGVNKTTTVCEYVTPNGFTAVKTGNRIDLSLTLLTYAKGSQPLSITLPTSVALRNQP